MINKKKQKILLLSILLFVLSFLAYLSLSSSLIKLPEISFDFKWTKALCEGNVCRDYTITCADGKVVDIKPVTGFVAFSDEWEDPRDEEFKEKMC